MGCILEYSLERGAAARLLRRLPEDDAARLRLRLRRVARPARLGALRRTAPLRHDFGYDRRDPGRPLLHRTVPVGASGRVEAQVPTLRDFAAALAAILAAEDRTPARA
jgi:hypothetical protein